jgi:hypothetical protein
MAITVLPGGAWVPEMLSAGPGSPPAFSNIIINAAGDKYGWVIQAPKTGTLDKAEFLLGAAGTPADLKLSFQDIALATGLPDGTPDQFRVIPSASVAAGWAVPGLMTDDGTDTGVKRSVTAGDLLGVVMEFDTTGGDVRPAPINVATNVWNTSIYSYTLEDTTGAGFTKSQRVGTLALKYDDGSYAYLGPHMVPAAAVTTTIFNSTDTPDEIGLRFAFPVSVQIDMVWVLINLGNAADLVIYDTDGATPLVTIALDPDVLAATPKVGAFRLPTPLTLAASSFYRVVLKPGASDISLYDFTVNAAALLGAMPGGPDFHLTSRTDAGAWTDTTTRRPWMGVHVSGVDVGGGGGGFLPARVFTGY